METKGGVPAGRTVLGTKKWPTWPQDGPPYRAQIDEKSMPKSIKKTMPFKIDFGNDFGGFFDGKWTRVGTQTGSKIDLFLKTTKSKNAYKTKMFLMNFEVRGVQVGSKNQSTQAIMKIFRAIM